MSSDTLFNVGMSEVDGTLWGVVEGELDLLTEPELVATFGQALDASAAAASVLDLRQVGFMDSSGLRAILLCRDRATAKGIVFSLSVKAGPVTRLLDATGVREWFRYA